MSSTDYRVLSVASGWYPIYCRPPVAKLASATRENRHPIKGAESSHILIGFGRSPSVPGLEQMLVEQMLVEQMLVEQMLVEQMLVEQMLVE